MSTSKNILKTYFQTGDFPSEAQFTELIDSFRHIDDGDVIKNFSINSDGDLSINLSSNETIQIEKFVLPSKMPISFIDGLQSIVDNSVTIGQLNEAIATSSYGIKYSWATATQRNAQTGMKKHEQGVQKDTREVYKYTGNSWELFYTLDAVHNHDDRYYKKSESDAKFIIEQRKVSDVLTSTSATIAASSKAIKTVNDKVNNKLDKTAKAVDSDKLDGLDSTAFAKTSHNHSWGQITGIPTTFPATTHHHDDRYYTEAESNNRFLGKTAKAADADKLDGLDGTSYAKQEVIPSTTLNKGWYTIAVNAGNRSSAKFVLRDTRSSYHQTIHFYAASHYGNGNVITVLSNSKYGNGGVFRYLRIKKGSTYDGALLQVYIDADGSPVYGLIMEDIQSFGWIAKKWVPDGTNPGNVKKFGALNKVAVEIDLDKTQGIHSSQEIFVNGEKVYHQGNPPTATEVGALPTKGKAADSDKLDGKDSSYFVALSNIVDNLSSTAANKPLSAKQGKVLKGLIDNINTILTSNDTSLDDIQEIVNYIKQNKSELQNLGISNIAGLQEALKGKENIFSKNTAFNKNFGTTAGTVAQGNHGHIWGQITGVPATFPATTHNHNDLYYTEKESDTKFLGKTAKAVDSDRLDGLDSSQFLQSISNYSKGVTTLIPRDASLSTVGSKTGTIKIALPQLWTSTMMKFHVDIFDYAINESITLIFSGYNYGGKYWVNTSAQILGSKVNRNFTIRFGSDGTKACVYIGELTSTWSYLKVAVTKGIFTYRNFEKEKWLTGWNISVVSSYGTINKTHTENLVVASNSVKLDGLDSSQFLRSDASDVFTGKLSVGSTTKRRAGIYGVYDSRKIGHIWSMGTAYHIAENGSNFGNLYGFAYKHTNNSTGGTMAGGHQAVWCLNGVPKVALGENGAWFAQNKFIEFAPNSSYKASLRLGGNGHTTSEMANIATSNGNLHIDAKKRHGIYLNYYTGEFTMFGNGASGEAGKIDKLGNLSTKGKITAQSDIYANGSFYYGDNKRIVQFTDSWLRLNPSNQFTSGIYCGQSIVRTDNRLEVGSGGSAFYANSLGDGKFKRNLTVNGNLTTKTVTAKGGDSRMSVLLIENEIRVPDAFSTSDPSIGILDNTKYGINISKKNGVGLLVNGTHRIIADNKGAKINGELEVNTNKAGALRIYEDISRGNSGSFWLVPRNAENTGWDTGKRFGFYRTERRWCVDGDFVVSGNLRSHKDVIAFSSSDKRLKNKIVAITSPIEKIKSISGNEFIWNDKQDTYEAGSKDYGVIAQEVAKILPEAVKENEETGYLSVRYEKLIPLLIEGIKVLQNQIEELQVK